MVSSPIMSESHSPTPTTEGSQNPATLPAKPPVSNESLAKTDPSQNLPKAFSRRRSSDSGAPRIESPYIATSEEKPAWLKSEQPTQKYDKYGARPAHHSKGTDASSTNDRYSKYVSNAASNNSRVKRRYEESEAGRDSRENDNAPPDADEIEAHRRRQDEYRVFQSKIANRETQNINNVVRLHYNQKVSHSRAAGSRTKSPIYKLRNFNNTIKYMLIGSHAVREPDSNKPFVILDLCCGKGGDLNKCEFVGIDNYIGIDISDMSVKEAFSRFRKSKAHFKVQDRQRQGRENKKYHFEACFATGDCFSTSVPDMLEPNFPGIINHLFPVDCVSIQFALHYAFETEEKVNMVVTNISRSLRQGGTFVGTIPSSDFLRDKISRQDYTLTDASKPAFGNSLYSVKFDNALPEGGIFRPPYGHRYIYNLKDAVDDVPEYVVPFETLRAVCESHGLRLRYKKNFLDIFRDEIPKYFNRLNSNLIEGLKRLDGKYGLEGEEKEAAAFYIGFVFEKL